MAMTRSRPSAVRNRHCRRSLSTFILAIAGAVAPPPLLLLPSQGVSARLEDQPPSRHQRRREEEDDRPICPSLPRPNHEDKYRTARWMAHSLDWGVLSTISTRPVSAPDGDDPAETAAPVPFGNVYSFVDGPCSNSTGVPYFYASMLDQSMQDILSYPVVSLTLSEASLTGKTPSECAVTPGGWGDPEMPPCGRLVLTGRFVRLGADGPDGGEELEFVRRAMLERHPSVQYWPEDHEQFAAKILLRDLWFLDWYGGASVLDLEEYYRVDLLGGEGTGEGIVSLE